MVISVRQVSPRRMVLDFRPVTVWAYRVIGLLLMGGGVVAALLLATSVSFRCTRLEGICRYQRTTPFGHEEQMFPIADLRGGSVETRTTLLVRSMMLVAMSRTGDVEIPLAAADGPTKDTLAVQLSRFAVDPLSFDFQIDEDGRLIGYLFGAFLVGVGLMCLMAIERVRLTMDRRAGMLHLRSRRFWRSRGTRIPLIRVKDVRTREHRYRNAASWSVTVILDGGAELPLTQLPLFTAISADQTHQLIRRWLA